VAPTTTDILGTCLFAIALVHTFSIKLFQHWALRYPSGSPAENLFHLLGEVEVVFGLWAGVLVAILAFNLGSNEAVHMLESLNFTEPLFVFVIMAMAATRPILALASSATEWFVKVLPFPRSVGFYVSALIFGPLTGSFITEPAAMTVTALLLKEHFFDRNLSPKFLYVTLAVLFVNISIGGTLTAFAAPPVLMVAGKWGWTSSFMATHFGWKAAIAVVLNTALAAGYFWKTLARLPDPGKTREAIRPVPFWLTAIHLAFLFVTVRTAHHPVFFMGVFLFFLGVVTITEEYQREIKLKESLLVAFFLAGLVVLGSFQKWWLIWILPQLGEAALFVGSTFLTGFVDNAALTYLGSQVPNLSATMQYALVAGAVAGGGLTVIANAPNPAGFSILKASFGAEGINPLWLFAYAIPPTLIAMAAFWFL